MKNIKYILVVFLGLSAYLAAAQNSNSAYFTKGYNFRHELNPAFGNEKNYVAFPVLGNMNMNVHGNLGLEDLIYNVNGKTVTFMNPGVSNQEFLSNIKDDLKFNLGLKMNVLSFGFNAWKGYNTVDVNIRSQVNTNIPGNLLRLAKEGLTNKSYNISDFSAKANAYAEVALGHSHQINDNLRIGGSLKMLLGIADIDAKMNKAVINLGNDEWTAVSEAEVHASMKGMSYKTETKMRGAGGKEKPHTYVSGMDVDGSGIGGFGVGVDLGVEYKLDRDWKFSLAVLDLGFINWKNNVLASTNGERTFSMNKYIFNLDDDAPNKFDNELDNLTAGLADLYELQDMGDQGSRSAMIGTTINAGAEYTLPTYQNLSFGLLSSTRLQKDYTWTEARLSANIAPVKFFSAGVNFAVGTYGSSMGWIMSIHPTGFNLFMAMDYFSMKYAKQGIPLKSNAAFDMGITIPF